VKTAIQCESLLIDRAASFLPLPLASAARMEAEPAAAQEIPVSDAACRQPPEEHRQQRSSGTVQCTSSSLPRPGFRKRGASFAFSLACFCIAAAAWSQKTPQSPPLPTDADQREAQARAELFRDRAFTKCGDGDSYYSGPFLINNKAGCNLSDAGAVHDCQMVVQMENPARVFARPDGPVQGGYQWAVTFDASRVRDRYRINGAWQPWGKFQSPQPPVVIASLLMTNGEWFGSDMRISGLEVSLAASAALNRPNLGTLLGVVNRALSNLGEMESALRPTPFDEFLRSISKPPCADNDSGTVSLRVRAPSHSLDDTYARTVEIVKENESKGIPDALAPAIQVHPGPQWLRPIPVCYAITHKAGDPPQINRQCEPTGEVVRLPGDLAVPPDFWQSYDRRCKEMHMQGPGLEVKLKDPKPDDGRKRYIHCGDAFDLGALREQLIELGFGK